MAIQFIPQSYAFDAPGTESGSYDFSTKVRTAGAAIQAFAASNGDDDHKLRNLEVTISNVSINGNRVTYDVKFNLQDDDGHNGTAEVSVLLMADTESA